MRRPRVQLALVIGGTWSSHYSSLTRLIQNDARFEAKMFVGFVLISSVNCAPLAAVFSRFNSLLFLHKMTLEIGVRRIGYLFWINFDYYRWMLAVFLCFWILLNTCSQVDISISCRYLSRCQQALESIVAVVRSNTNDVNIIATHLEWIIFTVLVQSWRSLNLITLPLTLSAPNSSL